MNDAQYSKLKNNGEYVVVNDIVIAKNFTGKYIAATVICSHAQQRQITFNADGNYLCTAHGALYNQNGKGLNQIGINGLKTYNVTVSGNTITILN